MKQFVKTGLFVAACYFIYKSMFEPKDKLDNCAAGSIILFTAYIYNS
jgi:hypothetical protein